MSLRREMRLAASRISRPVLGAAGGGVQSGVKARLQWWGLLPAIGISALLEQRDFLHDKALITREFEPELATLRHKAPYAVTRADLDAVAATNPLLEQAVARARAERNVRLLATAVAMIGAFALSTTLGPLLGVALMSGAGLATAGLTSVSAQALAGGALGFLGFLAIERPALHLGRAVTHLHEPRLAEVAAAAHLQAALSAPSQLRYLEGLQAERRLISQEHIATLLLTARPDVATTLEARMGAPFATLAPESKRSAIAFLGQDWPLEQHAEALNARRMRVQELAFFVHGQISGIVPADTPPSTVLETAQAHLQQAKAQIQVLGQQAEHLRRELQRQTGSTFSKLTEPWQKAGMPTWTSAEQQRSLARQSATPER